jgi:glucose-1-phosphate thymidylyltransferase
VADPAADLTDAQRRAADAGAKAMMPIGGRPFLDFVLGSLADAGIRQVALVVPPAHDELRRHYAAHPPKRVDVALVVQPEPLGTANATLAAEGWSAGDPFILVNGDNLYPAGSLRATAALDEPGLAGFDRDDLVRTSNIEPARLRAFAALETDADGYLTRIVEKPARDHPVPGLVSMNCWRFDDRIFAACRDVARSPRGEYELPAAVTLAQARGVRFRVIRAAGPVLDLSNRTDTAEVARRLGGRVPEP